MMLECFLHLHLDLDVRRWIGTNDTIRCDTTSYAKRFTRTHIREQCLSFCFHIWGTGNANISTGA